MAGGNSKAIALPSALIKEYSVFKTDYSSIANIPPFPLILAFIAGGAIGCGIGVVEAIGLEGVDIIVIPSIFTQPHGNTNLR